MVSRRGQVRFRYVLGMVMILATGIPLSPPAGAETDWAEAINTAGRQRMLTQRITRAYVQAGLGANAGVATRQLEQSVTRFDGQLALNADVVRPGTIRVGDAAQLVRP